MSAKKMISYRSIWMGIAMLWIMAFHSKISVSSHRVLQFLIQIGYGGVDIFIFASGIGNYYSYLRDENPLAFLARRIKRLAPTYIPIILIWCIYYVSQGWINVWNVPGNILGVQGRSADGGSFNWYIACIIICYLITPYLATCVKKNDLKKNLLLVIVLIIISFAFLNDHQAIIIYTRLPIYAVGMIIAKYEEFDLTRIRFLLLLMFFAGGVFLVLSYK